MTDTARRWAAAVLVTAGIALAAVGLTGSGPDEAAGADGADAAAAAGPGDTVTVPPGTTPSTAVSRPSMGDPDAPLTIIEYSDYLCPFCGRFADEVMPELVARYVDTGLVRIEWHDYPLKGDPSLDAAVAARAADRQGSYWAYHDALFALHGQLSYERAELVAIAEALGLDTERFTADLDDPALESAVRADLVVGQQVGVRGTPSFLIGGVPLVGAQPLAAFTDVIDAQLAERGLTPDA